MVAGAQNPSADATATAESERSELLEVVQMISFSFTKPAYLVLLVIIPLIIIIHFLTLKRKRTHALKFANFDAIAKIKGIDLISKNLSILLLTAVISALLVLSLSGFALHLEKKASSFSFVIAIDSSSSMEANDIAPTRLDAAKETASFFVNQVSPGSKVGIISFSGNSLIETDLTDDTILIKQSINKIRLSSIGGTDLQEAVLTSSNLLEGEDAKSVVLISDGRINVGTVDDVILTANKKDIVVHTIGVGTLEGGQTQFAMSKLDEDSLKSVAYNTGGQYFRAQSKAQFQDSFNDILDFKTKKVSVNVTNYLLLAAIFLLILEYVLINTRYKIFP